MNANVFALGLVLPALALCSFCAMAQPLSLERALALAEENNPRLRAAAAQSDAARAGIATARQYPNPEVEALSGGVRARVPGVTGGTGTSITLAQPVELPMVRTPRIRAAEAGFEGSQLGLAEFRLALRAEVKKAFYDVLRRKAEYDLALDNQKLLDDIRRRIGVRVNVGEAPKLELTRAEAEAQSAANQAASAKLRVSQALARLRATIGAPLPADYDVAGELPPGSEPPDLALLREEVLTRYPALAQSRAEARRAEARVETERALRIPQPTVFAGVDRDPETRRTILGLALPLPIFNQRQGQIGEAVAAFQQANANVDARQVEVLASLEDAYRRFQVASQQIAAFQGGLLVQAEAALRAAEAAYRFGERGFIEVLDAQRVLRSVRADFLTAKYERQSALIDLEQLRAIDLQGAPQ
jgi:cobalt-zinc-cadmium efflux system outer membrane protein